MGSIVGSTAAPIACPTEFGGAKAGLARRPGAGAGFVRRGAEKLGGIGELRLAFPVAEQAIDRLRQRLAQRIPERDLDSRKGVRRLQQVHAVELHGSADSGDIAGIVQRLAEHRFADRPAGAMGHRRDVTGYAGQWRGLALAPADMRPRLHAHQQRVLAAVGVGGDYRHGEIEEVDRIDLHARRPRGLPQGRKPCGKAASGVRPSGGRCGPPWPRLRRTMSLLFANLHLPTG